MPVAVCSECCRDYYLPGERVADPRCDRCGAPLVWVDEVQAEPPSGPPPDPPEEPR